MYFELMAGSVPTFTYTLSLTFDYGKKLAARKPSCARRWQMTAIEYATTAIKYKAINEKNTIIDLIPIFKTQVKQEIKTSELLHLRLDYCFGPQSQYNITITTIADDHQSGFATYACVKTYVQERGKCDTKTLFKDISGGAANFVQVHLNGPQDYGTVELLVRGDGRYKGNNLFTLAASAPTTV